MTVDFEVMVFDLDDTLYLERDFAYSGFRATGDWMRATIGVETFAQRCTEIFAGGQRTKVFDTVLEGLGLAHRTDILTQLIELYRCHEVSIALAPDAERYLRGVRARRRAIITDGFAGTQMAKIKALSLEDHVDLVICTDNWGREFWKPHERAFAAIEAWSGVDPGHIVYVADNPLKDFVTPRRRGWQTVGIARPERVHFTEAPEPSYEPHATIKSFEQLDDCLAALSHDREWILRAI